MRVSTRLAWRPDGFEPKPKPTIDMTAIGGRINTLIGESESINSIADLARAADVSSGTMGGIVSGEIKTPSKPVLVKIANALNVDVDELIDLLEDEALESAGESFQSEQKN